MTSGGARTRSGPAKDPNSRTSERLGYELTALPATGYAGEEPSLRRFMPDATDRHRDIWVELWHTPQAVAWVRDRWRWPAVADLTRRMVQSEDPATPIAVATAIRQLRDDLGLSAAGLKQHGWTIAHDEVTPLREEKPKKAPSSRDRLKVVKAGGA